MGSSSPDGQENENGAPPDDQTASYGFASGYEDRPENVESDEDGSGADTDFGGGMIGESVDGGGMGSALSDSTVQYMMDNYDGERYLVAVPSAAYAESIILKYGVGVMALGGFTGNDNAITLDDFITLVENGELRYYWAGGSSNSEITTWVEANGLQVSDSEITGGSSTDSSGSTSSLYDLSGLRGTN